ncbi:MAG TPA: heme-binding protein [Planctomycetota bacterium]|nr:heme-binding protein [Planctomycetota bacterium]
MAVERLDGTFPASAKISIGNAETAAMFRRPTKGLRVGVEGAPRAVAAR